jgi:MFS family permease
LDSKNLDQSLQANLRALPRTAWILFFGTFLNKFGTFVVPFLALYLTGKGYSIADTGIAIGAYGVGNIVASILGGYLADFIGRRMTIVISMFSSAVAMLLLSQAHSLSAITLLTGLAGLTSEMYRPAASALLTDLIVPERRVTAFSAYRLAFNAGWAFGPATAGFLAARGFFWLFVGDAGTSILFGLVAFFALPKGAPPQREGSDWRETVQVLRHSHRFHQLLIASFGVAFIFFQMGSTYGLHVTHLGFSAKIYGAILSLNGVLVVICELPISNITRRLPERKVIAIGYVLAGLGFALNSCTTSVVGLAVCMTIFTFGEMVSVPVSHAYVANLAPAHMRGRFIGAYGLTWALALVIGPGLGMKMLAASPMFYWVFCGALGILSALIILMRVPGHSSAKLAGASEQPAGIE